MERHRSLTLDKSNMFYLRQIAFQDYFITELISEHAWEYKTANLFIYRRYFKSITQV